MLKPTPRINLNRGNEAGESTVRSLFDTEEAPLLRYAYALVGRRAVAEEIVQEVFLQLHVRWSEIESPRAWLYRSVRNGVYSHLRKSRRETLADTDDTGQQLANEQELPESWLLRNEATGLLRQVLDELKESDRELVQLKYFDGLRYREISERTGLSVSNVGYRLHHILKAIAEKMRPLGVDEIS